MENNKYDKYGDPEINLIAEAFETFNIDFFVTNVEGDEILSTLLSVANAPFLDLQFMGSYNADSVLSFCDVKARVYGLYHKVPSDMLGRVYSAINDLNGKLKFMSIHMDSEMDIYMKYDIPACCSRNDILGRIALEVLADTKQFLKDNYCALFNVLCPDKDGEFVPQQKWERDANYLKEQCSKVYGFRHDPNDALEGMYAQMEYESWTPFDEPPA